MTTPDPATHAVEEAAAVEDDAGMPTHEQLMAFEEQVGAIVIKLGGALEGVEPHMAVTALLRVAGGTAQTTTFSRDHLAAMTVEAFDKTRQLMQMLGVNPGEAPPADLQKRIQKLVAERQAAAATAAEG